MNTSAEQFYNGALGNTFACFPLPPTKLNKKGGRKLVTALSKEQNIHPVLEK